MDEQGAPDQTQTQKKKACRKQKPGQVTGGRERPDRIASGQGYQRH